VLEIGFRRFVPYAQAEFRPNASTKRGPTVRLKKSNRHLRVEGFTEKKNKKGKKLTIKARTPVVKLTDDVLFDLMPVITDGIQKCVDSFVMVWSETEVLQTRGRWHSYESEASIFIRIPVTTQLLCATAYFAEMKWRLGPNKQLHSVARSIRDLLIDFMVLNKKQDDGTYLEESVKESENTTYVANKLRCYILYRSYTLEMINCLIHLIGEQNSTERILLEQVWRLFKLEEPVEDASHKAYITTYGEMQDVLLEQWHVKNYRSLRHERVRKQCEEERTSQQKPYHSHGKSSATFSVFASKQVLEQMMYVYDAKKLARANGPVADQDDDIPF